MYGFDIPVTAVDTDFDLAILGTKGKWYDHVVSVRDAVEKAAEAETPADGTYTLSLIHICRMPPIIASLSLMSTRPILTITVATSSPSSSMQMPTKLLSKS